MGTPNFRYILWFVLMVGALATAQTSPKPSQALSNSDKNSAGNPPNECDQKLPQGTKPELPDAPSEAVRLTTHQKFETFVKRTYSPYTFASAASSATWAQMWGDYDYGGGMQGWGKRYGANVANAEIRNFFNSFALPVVFRQDPRYHPYRKEGLIPRSLYAGSRVLVTRSDDGKQMFNYSEVLGVLFTSSIQNSYYPRRDRGFDETVLRFVGGIGSDAASNVLREFSPDISKIARKIVPKKAQKIERRIPEPVRRGINPRMAD